MKAATIYAKLRCSLGRISIHAAREGGDFASNPTYEDFGISIHAAREGGDTLPYWSTAAGVISIHAAREGGDSVRLTPSAFHFHFNPRRP